MAHVGQEKFDTCKYRPKEMVKIRSCCAGDVKVWICKKRQLRNLTPDICFSCNSYSKKD